MSSEDNHKDICSICQKSKHFHTKNEALECARKKIQIIQNNFENN